MNGVRDKLAAAALPVLACLCLLCAVLTLAMLAGACGDGVLSPEHVFFRLCPTGYTSGCVTVSVQTVLLVAGASILLGTSLLLVLRRRASADGK